MRFAATTLAIVITAAVNVAVPSRAAPLSAVEHRIVAAVERHAPESLALLERAVNVNSGTMNFDGVREVGRIFQPEFERLGFKVRWADGAAWGRAGHLIAERRGKDARMKVLLIGHLDTVFERDSPFQKWERLDDSTAHGPGTSDMKGGDVVMLLALRALAEAGALERLNVVAVLTGDEEKSGTPRQLARADLIAAAQGADLALGFEDGDGDPRSAVVARRGSVAWVLRTQGKPAHSSQIFRSDIGAGAIYEAARILAAFRDSLAGDPLLTFNPGAIVGGSTITFDHAAARGTAFGKDNVVAETTLVTGDLRALTPGRRDSTQAAMRRIVARHAPQTQATIEFDDGYPPLAPAPGNLELLGRFDRASRDLGFGPVGQDDPARAGAADISFTSGIVPRALDGLGVGGSGGHTVGETADLRSLPIQAKRVAVMLARLGAESR